MCVCVLNPWYCVCVCVCLLAMCVVVVVVVVCVCVLVVFMGSEKYSGENTFESFLSKHGGFSNASTDYEKVCSVYASYSDVQNWLMFYRLFFTSR